MKARALIIVLLALVFSVGGVISAQRFEWVSENQATALLASLIPLFGVLVTLQWSHKQFLHQLENERRATEADRRFRLKQDAFVAAAEAVLAASGYIFSLPDRMLPMDGSVPPETKDFAAALTKLHYCAELKTIEVVIPLARALTNCLLAGTQAKLPSLLTSEDIRVLDGQVEFWEKQNAEITQLIQAIAQSHPDHQSVTNLVNQRVENRKRIDELLETKVGLVQLRYGQVEACRDVVLKSVAEITPLALSFHLRARDELGFEIDAEKYRQLMSEESQAILDQMQRFVADVRSQVRARME